MILNHSYLLQYPDNFNTFTTGTMNSVVFGNFNHVCEQKTKTSVLQVCFIARNSQTFKARQKIGEIRQQKYLSHCQKK